MGQSELYLVRMRLATREIARLAERRHLRVADMDEGYLIHCVLRELFKDAAPQPFASRQSSQRGHIDVHGYSDLDTTELERRAGAFGDVALYQGFDWNSLAAKPIPRALPSQLGFSVRLCPVVRLARDVDITVDDARTGKPRRIERRKKRDGTRGSEVDAFEAACIRSRIDEGAPVPSERRGEIYLSWFRELMERVEGVELRGCRLRAMRWTRLIRRTHEQQRTSRTLRRPDVTVEGVLDVGNQAAFHQLLKRGVGRHRAFGFGMIRLIPAAEVVGC
jgi:CRISPR system Cascade subunit CasE